MAETILCEKVLQNTNQHWAKSNAFVSLALLVSYIKVTLFFGALYFGWLKVGRKKSPNIGRGFLEFT
ncbi:hypothetical protein [Marinomonas fungiae]|uniref:hypothetical protein n=1 Tax=Marinomonas fungiae TaxID=1137284 RepID=UPI003A931052